MAASVRTGFLLTADVSGYTEFLTASELEHAHAIMQDVMQTISTALRSPVEIVKYEGDAVLCYALDALVRDPVLLIDLLEQTYLRFADHILNVARTTTCQCKACANVRLLDLKFFVHHGKFILDQTDRGLDVSGPHLA